MSLERILGLFLRYTYVYRRSWIRVLEFVFWPVMDLLVWGYLTLFLSNAEKSFSRPFQFLIGAMILWDVLYRTQLGITVSFLEDVWSKNLINLLVTPITIQEFFTAIFLVGIFKSLLILGLLGFLAALFYHFHLTQIGFYLLPLIGNLFLMGSACGVLTISLLLRWGQAAESLAWAIPILFQPFAAVFYPLYVLPKWIQPLSFLVPATHVFEGLRGGLQGTYSYSHLFWATFLNCCYLGFSFFLFQRFFISAREKGLLVKIGTQ
ncbi:ABC transporter permease [Candidatus Methylacidiphilum fumarolicum]|uniref:ABC-type multidrug transport system, permease component n=2 Tax=Candidatus Methylacidiphilum fumarolicum TaxID=591154 RepID=I0JW65_METFB|nr:ABC transporter permease [Candidatus Methylacidiphilum fumarolicum]MBW6415752.1 ABC transporter permease [Candidatus Methylacidiphilum fumarolicum]TFE65850.1 ABC transporter [Candidatus Methylacidiphilum fumarolicum]TFE71828.1 ABC transporter permease [Candidatus Methylacidiphilum fumarolicum]TFE72032.1 ABC transporter permease [Candidatus Methylacidiphilum fumarolicum]TFE76460.1 ABC transporter [Candidatus Methylacidiphilum fumarolicum]